MNLNNSLPYPPNTRRCFWDAEYIASQPFCITTKLTEKEAKELSDFEEMKFWERCEQIKETLSLQAQFEIEETLEEIKKETLMESAEMGLKGLDSYNIQTNHRLRGKNIKKSDYLTR